MSLGISAAFSFLQGFMQAAEQNKRYLENAKAARKAAAHQSDGLQQRTVTANRQVRQSAYDTAMKQMSQKSAVISAMYERGLDGNTLEAARSTMDQQIGQSRRRFTEDAANTVRQGEYQARSLQMSTQSNIDRVQQGGNPLFAGLMAAGGTYARGISNQYGASGSTSSFMNWYRAR